VAALSPYQNPPKNTPSIAQAMLIPTPAHEFDGLTVKKKMKAGGSKRRRERESLSQD
jgi:hypothetical protein